MDIDEVYALLKDDIDEVKTICAEIRIEARRTNGQCQQNRWSIKAIWLVLAGEISLFVWWIKSLIGRA